MLRRNKQSSGPYEPQPIGFEEPSNVNNLSPQDRIIQEIRLRRDAHTLRQLNLSHSNIAGEIKFWTALKQLRNLETLQLHDNNIVEAHLSYLVDCPHLRRINLNNNSLKDLSLNRVFPRLQSLSCINNQLLKVSFISNNPSLLEVDVSHNRISVLNTEQLPNLQRVDASDNQLVVVSLNNKVREVLLVRCQLKSVVFLNKLNGSLRVLDVSYNSISDIRHTNLLGLAGLEEANFQHNQIRAVEGLQHCKASLRKLDLSFNKLFQWQKLFVQLKQLTKLEDVLFTENQFCNNPRFFIKDVETELLSYMSLIKVINGHHIDPRVRSRKSSVVSSSYSTPTMARHSAFTSSNFNSIMPPPVPEQSKHASRKMEKMINTNGKKKPAQNSIQEEFERQFKESPFKLYTDVLQDSKRQQTAEKGYARTKKPFYQQQQAHYTLGQHEDVQYKEEITFEDGYQAQQNSFSLHTTLPIVSQIKKPCDQELKQLLNLCLYPSRPMLRTQANTELISKIQPDPKNMEFSIISQIFERYVRRVDLLKKVTHWNRMRKLVHDRSGQEIWSQKTQNMPVCLAFLFSKKLNQSTFRELCLGKSQLDKAVTLSKSSEGWILTTDPTCMPTEYCVIAMVRLSQKISLSNLHKGVPLTSPALDQLVPIYLVEANEIK